MQQEADDALGHHAGSQNVGDGQGKVRKIAGMKKIERLGCEIAEAVTTKEHPIVEDEGVFQKWQVEAAGDQDDQAGGDAMLTLAHADDAPVFEVKKKVPRGVPFFPNKRGG